MTMTPKNKSIPVKPLRIQTAEGWKRAQIKRRQALAKLKVDHQKDNE